MKATVSVASYTSTSNPYNITEDGYLVISSGTVSSGYASVDVYGKPNSTGNNFALDLKIERSYQNASLFVRKGFSLVVSNKVTGVSYYFIPIT